MSETIVSTRHNVEGRQMRNFRLKIGQAAVVNAQGETRLYYQGSRIRTPTNLTKRFGEEKFERISDGDIFDEEGHLFEIELTEKSLNAINDDTDQYRQDHPMNQAETSSVNDARHRAALEQMELEELVKMAGEEEIPLGNAKTKKAIINIIEQYDKGGIQIGAN